MKGQISSVKGSLLPQFSYYTLAKLIRLFQTFGIIIQPNLVLAEVYSLTFVPMDTEAQALIQILQSILDH